jgi:hypothetical protein
MRPVWLAEALRIYFRSLRTKLSGLPVYKGNAEEICKNIVERCWNKKQHYFQTSAGHFCQFYTRDFGWCVKPLLNLGYKEEVLHTLDFALRHFAKKNKITVALSRTGTPFDFPNYAVDSLPYLLHSLSEAKALDLVERFESLLQSELIQFCAKVLDTSTGLVNPNKCFSSAKDHCQRSSSCYDNVMVGMLSADLNSLGLHNPLTEYDYKRLLRFNFWNGSAFIDDLSGKDTISGDANVFPYWSGIFGETFMIKSSIKNIQNLQLDYPFPLKYTGSIVERSILYDKLTPNYEGNSIWTYLGLLYTGTVCIVNKKLAARYLMQYTDVIEKFGNLLEVFDPHGAPYRSKFYLADDSMLWAAIYLDLVKRLK